MESASIELSDVWLEYPIYGSRSLKNMLLGLATQGRLDRSEIVRVQASSAVMAPARQASCAYSPVR
jgi:hypothetical protein